MSVFSVIYEALCPTFKRNTPACITPYPRAHSVCRMQVSRDTDA